MIPKIHAYLSAMLLFTALSACGSDSSDSGAIGASGASGASGATGAAGAAPQGDRTHAVVAAAENFLSTLDAAQKTAVSFSIDDEAQRLRWSNLPTGLFERQGVKLGDMTAAQADAAFALLATILSPAGYQQIVATVNADEKLKSTSTDGKLVFGRAEYFIAILGTPSASATWAVQFGGHHLAINATIQGATISLTPSLTGAQPTSFDQDGVTVRVQGAELDQAFALIGSLSAEQQQKAIIGSTFVDLVLGPGQDGKTLPAEGIKATELTAAQRAQLMALVKERIGLLNDEDAAPRLAAVEATLDETYFAWAGGTTAASAAYYRVAGPAVAIEYAPQQMGGSATNHTHAMYRDPTLEYGRSPAR